MLRRGNRTGRNVLRSNRRSPAPAAHDVRGAGNHVVVPGALVQYETAHGAIELDRTIVRQYFCRLATDLEIDVFIKLCFYQKLNPFLREVYLVKYGTAPATMIVGWHVFLARAETNPNFDGYEVELYDQDDRPYRGRAQQDLVYATAKVYRKDRKYPVSVTVLFKEYNTNQGNWKPDKMPTTMLESNPPLKKAPSGTSEISRRRTDSVKRSRH